MFKNHDAFYCELTCLFLALLGVEIIFFALSFDIGCCRTNYDSSIAKLLKITSENNLPTWFGSVQALAVGVVAWMIMKTPSIRAHRWQKYAWFLICALFIFISIDDGASSKY